ncbi:hypothetical protein, partial [Rhodococcus baikonurensis]|uniref:hypothetical protein n=1 Tax=Rhodococcus baikonurensis TaxID=172041 RepID=UPI00339753F6
GGELSGRTRGETMATKCAINGRQWGAYDGRRQSSVPVSAGELTLTGLAADVSAGSTVDAEVGYLTLAGLDADVTTSIGPVFDPGELLFEGLEASVSVSSDVAAEAGVLTLTGSTAEISVGSTVGAVAGSLTLDGYVAEVSSGSTVTATDVGYMTLTGLAAEISSGSTVAASTTPALTLTGLAADVVSNNGPFVSAFTTFSKTTGSAVTITLPAANVGDLWVIAMATTSGQMGSTPSGWTKRMGNGAWYDGAYLEVWTRTKVAGDPATITTSASGFSSDSPTEVIAMTVANQAGVNASSSILSDGSTTATPHPTPAITTTVAKAVLIRMVSTGQLSAAHTWPAGVTPVTTVINGTSAALSVAVQTGGAAGSQAAVNATPSNGSKYSSGTIAIAPV